MFTFCWSSQAIEFFGGSYLTSNEGTSLKLWDFVKRTYVFQTFIELDVTLWKPVNSWIYSCGYLLMTFLLLPVTTILQDFLRSFCLTRNIITITCILKSLASSNHQLPEECVLQMVWGGFFKLCVFNLTVWLGLLHISHYSQVTCLSRHFFKS